MFIQLRDICHASMVAAVISLAIVGRVDASTITAAEAANHVGEQQTVCGMVTSTHFASGSRGQPTFINLDRPYPNQIFTVMIWGSDRPNFPNAPEVYYRGKGVCVTGLIKSYRGKPEIIASRPDQIRLQ